MIDILKTRKMVQYYVWYNLGMAVLSLFIGFIIALVYSPETSVLSEQIANNGKVMAITIEFAFDHGVLWIILAFFTDSYTESLDVTCQL
jgi:ribose 5-phosphate isomerase RpiB